MDTFLASEPRDLGPIDPDWTISELLQWLSDDIRQHDAALHQPLTRIEALITGTRWRGAPSTVSLIRSLAAAARSDAALPRTRIRDLDPYDVAEPHDSAERVPQLA
ncbi:hypothetical protein [Microbacterium sp. NPDC087591]|uniref:hypothetical protein n=1 Tax=Microbacterium sp. NPDC087591 TaxID=3364192 RepID=UPI0038239BEE